MCASQPLQSIVTMRMTKCAIGRNASYAAGMVCVVLRLNLRTALFSGFLLCLAACGSEPPQVKESDPFEAAAQRVKLHRWQELLREAEALVMSASVPPTQIEELVNRLRMERDRAMGDKKDVMPLEVRRRSAQLIAHLEHLRRMTASPARASLAHQTKNSPAPIIFDWPVRDPRVASGFGLRPDPFTPGLRSFHNGIDFAAPAGTIVYPAARGDIVEAGFRDDGCGLAVTIIHPDGFASDYCHLGEVKVRVGQYVTRTEILGHIGDTGRSTGAHLHWSVWKLGSAIDPRRVIGRRNDSPR